ncbi:hypothetical protein HNQ07_004095 [Deinococcus metalli]|uniref:Uncharacterized protein n=1 Tax=Deinococcus metalli TaxID=1141878 RepID=A0A7W8NT17_9DEIO|nr:hypothetical protein [Deinococcus metalli]MBB5378588.1 hypothetical protein [Deinococcus metalli]GHF60981.1 hypothetical protein GCM10017781_41380 [Deinococcus metalli]
MTDRPSEAFTLTLEESVFSGPPALQAIASTVQITGLQRHQRSRRLQLERRHPQLQAERRHLPLSLHRPTYAYQFDRLSHIGLERVLARHLVRSGTLTVGLADIVGIFARYGQIVTFAQVPVILAASQRIRFGQWAAHRWTLLPWERLQVTWPEAGTAVMSVLEYEQLALRFWSAHEYAPDPNEEPSARVRGLARRTVGRVPALPWLTPAADGSFELEVKGVRGRYRVDVQGLPDGKLGNIWMRGTRLSVHTARHAIVGVDATGRRYVLTAAADEVIVRLVAPFRDPVYVARRVDLGEQLYRALRAHRVRLRVNGQ